MAETAKPGLLERVEEEAREILPLWHWFSVTACFFLLFQLADIYAAQIKLGSGMLQREEIIAILVAQVVGMLALVIFGSLDKKKGYSHRLLRLPDPRETPPGPFRLGAGMASLIPGLWWIVPALSTLAGLYIGFFALDDRNSPEATFWLSQELLGWFLILVLGTLGILTVAGRFIGQRLRKRAAR